MTPAFNPHKKGEHVFNDFSGSLDNAVASALKTDSVKRVALVGRFPELAMTDLPKTTSCLDRVRQDRTFIQARTVVAPATGIHNDPNSTKYGNARKALEDALSSIIVTTGVMLFKQIHTHGSSFHEFEKFVATLNSLSDLKNGANKAVDSLFDAGHDPQAEASALSERVAETELTRRRMAITSMKLHIPALKQTGHLLVTSFSEEVRQLLQARIHAQ